ncbi:glycerate kinase [Belliella sp. DSM 111904]|uniref:Glycerate kinase n=1 Tax=Belliella filtrata TaxID=2923435 RepID=A0ABS9UWR9_9BACT|nr:glycerate kinase [Belliella filtrata]MCH7408390.1 glycerate kinase [Belliella filtrata]
MKILIAPNAFKGTISANRACEVIESVLDELMPSAKLISCPIADGGDGTCELLGKYLSLEKVNMMVLDALGRSKLSFFYWDGEKERAYIDVSSATGISGLSINQRDPFVASTYGTGMLISKAIEYGANEIVLGLGGSASIDLGLGILDALGFTFLDGYGRELVPFSDISLSQICHIQRPVYKYNVSFTFLCDVDHHFFGEAGGLYTFGPQKGLYENDFLIKEKHCKNALAQLSKKAHQQIHDQSGFGAAGGVAYGLSFFFPVNIQPGASWFFKKVSLEEKIMDVDLVITGEGRYDAQSSGGKGSFELVLLAKKHKKKTILITSGVEGIQDGFDDLIRLPPINFQALNFQDIAIQNLENSLRLYFE